MTFDETWPIATSIVSLAAEDALMSRYFRTAIAAALRILSKPVLVVLAGSLATPSHATPTKAEPTPQKQTLRAFFDELGRDEALRARFAQSPRGVLAERGLALPSIALPDRLSESEIDRLLSQWPAIAAPTSTPARAPLDKSEIVATQFVPSVVYGPPAGPRPRPEGTAPAPVYGPPAGLRPNGTVRPLPGVPRPANPNRATPKPGNGAPDDTPPGLY